MTSSNNSTTDLQPSVPIVGQGNYDFGIANQTIDYNIALRNKPNSSGVTWGSITGALSSQTDLQSALNAKANTTTTISAGTGLSGGGDLSANRTLNLANTAVTPGSYTISNITVDAQGRITAASSGGTTTNAVCASVYRSTDYVLTTTATAITFDLEFLDTNTFHDNAVNNSRVTIPFNGKYELGFVGEIISQNAGDYQVSALIRKNGTTTIASGNITLYQQGVAGGYTILNLTAPLQSCVIGDYFEVLLSKSNATPTMSLNGTTTGAHHFDIKLLGA